MNFITKVFKILLKVMVAIISDITKKPKGISKYKVGKNEYFKVQLNGYRGNYKTYNEAKKIRDEILRKEYNYIDIK